MDKVPDQQPPPARRYTRADDYSRMETLFDCGVFAAFSIFAVIVLLYAALY